MQIQIPSGRVCLVSDQSHVSRKQHIKTMAFQADLLNLFAIGLKLFLTPGRYGCDLHLQIIKAGAFGRLQPGERTAYSKSHT